MKKQNGFTLIELMIGITLGLIILAGVLGFFWSTLKTNIEMTKQQQFDQTVQLLLNRMVADIRRAGYANVGVTLTAQANGTVPNPSYFHPQGHCATFSHSIPGQDERFYGYKVENNMVYMYDQPKASGNANCANLTNWVAVTDTSVIKVSVPADGLVFKDTPFVTIHLIAEAVGMKNTEGEAVARDFTAQVKIRNS